ncbi:dihydropteroate synthase [Rhodoblastus acidophilus]|uniref:dihydropteroate synthase n=1 Tax=Candidatus Rhodoblastus alkanivorans TaxID=2954117 RepID=A0ABS9Z3Z9_9HYPH|nr:dihydropteroate synthase [Candidatus Rhodoblastus alkanivorans]MCI4677350.1 dihydropteroate synthase [Candidatus Rhodoblastus alkanivorans]MCI4682085.1 dihydropteroate synthase [Candidatus Rhodoblastus alkanivorans]MDI4639387.1 dihydropteroate synthase [Rhodoblastus acidophilus]
MGILNVTPDSFSDGGRFVAAEAALAHAQAMEAAGADMIDIGAESTRPGFAPVDEAEEWARLEPVLAPLLARIALPVSVDTTKAAVARRAALLGATAINDVSGLRADPAMAEVAAASGAALIVMHHCAEADAARDIVADMLAFFGETLERAEKAGVAREKIVLDPGVGFGKTLRQNLQAIDACGALREKFGLPVLIGASRKSFIGALTGAPVGERLAGTLAAHLRAFSRGASIFRVHDVAEHVGALRIWSEIERA